MYGKRGSSKSLLFQVDNSEQIHSPPFYTRQKLELICEEFKLWL